MRRLLNTLSALFLLFSFIVSINVFSKVFDSQDSSSVEYFPADPKVKAAAITYEMAPTPEVAYTAEVPSTVINNSIYADETILDDFLSWRETTDGSAKKADILPDSYFKEDAQFLKKLNVSEDGLIEGTLAIGGKLNVKRDATFKGKVTIDNDEVEVNGVSYFFPEDQASNEGYVLANDGSGNLTWSNVNNYTTGVSSITGTTNQINASSSTGGVTLSIPSTFVVPGTMEVTGNTTFNGTTTFGDEVTFSEPVTLGSVSTVADNNTVLTDSGGTISAIDTTNWDKDSSDDFSGIVGTDNRTARFNAAGDNVENGSINDDYSGIAVGIDSSGQVGIGTTVPGSQLAVSGGATIGSGYSTYAAPTNGLSVQGFVGVGTTASLYNFDVNGAAYIDQHLVVNDGLFIGAGEDTGDYISAASYGSTSNTLYIGNESILASGDIGTSVQGYDADLVTLSGLSSADSNFIVGSPSGWVVESGSTVRTSLGLGTIATQNANAVSISGGSITGITDLAVADGGTGASDASGARANLGLIIGTNVQAYDAGLQSIAGLTTSANQMIYTTGSDTYATTSLSAFGRTLIDDADATTARSTLGLGTSDSPQFTGLTLSSPGTGTDNTVLILNSSNQVKTDEIDSRVWGSTLLDASSSSTNYIPKWSDSNTLTNGLLYDNGSAVLMGDTSISRSPGAGMFHIESDTTTPVMQLWQNTADANGPNIYLGKTRGAIDSNTQVADNDNLGSLIFYGGDGGVNTPSRAATIFAEVDGTPGNGDVPGALVFSTTQDNSGLGPEERMRIDDAGNVGIGISPTTLLHVNGATTSTSFLGNASDTLSTPSFSWTGDTNTGMYHSGTDSLGLVTNGAERLVIGSSGYIGVNTTANSRFDIYEEDPNSGTHRALRVDHQNLLSDSGSTVSTSGIEVLANNSGSDATNTTIYGVKATTVDSQVHNGSPIYTHDIYGVYGSATGNTFDNTTARGIWCMSSGADTNQCGGNQTWTQISDARVKTEISTITSALDIVESLRGVRYRRTDDGSTKLHVGFIAQEVLPFVPEVVSYDLGADRYSMAYAEITPILVNAMQEQQGQINALKEANLGFTDSGKLLVNGEIPAIKEVQAKQQASIDGIIKKLTKLDALEASLSSLTTKFNALEAKLNKWDEVMAWTKGVGDSIASVIFKVPTVFSEMAFFNAPIKVNADTSETIEIPSGTLKAKVKFTKEFPDKPSIYISFVDGVPVAHEVTDITQKGFTISFDEATSRKFKIQWLAILRDKSGESPSIEIIGADGGSNEVEKVREPVEPSKDEEEVAIVETIEPEEIVPVVATTSASSGIVEEPLAPIEILEPDGSGIISIESSKDNTAGIEIGGVATIKAGELKATVETTELKQNSLIEVSTDSGALLKVNRVAENKFEIVLDAVYGTEINVKWVISN